MTGRGNTTTIMMQDAELVNGSSQIVDKGNTYTIQRNPELSYYKKQRWSDVLTPVYVLGTTFNVAFSDDDLLVIEGSIIANSELGVVYSNASARLILGGSNSPDSSNYPITIGNDEIIIDMSTRDSDIQFYNITYTENAVGVNYTDNNTTGETVDSTTLLYVGGDPITAQCIGQKQNTLFLGNIELIKPTLSTLTLDNTTINFSSKLMYNENSENSFYNYSPYTLSLSDYASKTLKSNEYYRFGFIAQHKSGKWSEAFFIKDAKNTNKNTTYYSNIVPVGVRVFGTKASYTINSSTINQLASLGYVKIKPIIVYPNISEKEVVAQGVINPTLYNVEDRYRGNVDSIASWFFRPIYPGTFGDATTSMDTTNYAEFRHNKSLPANNKGNNEIQSTISNPSVDSSLPAVFNTMNGSQFFIDQSFFTFNSPDIEFDDSLKFIDNTTLKFRIIGKTNITARASDLSISTTTGPRLTEGGFSYYDTISKNYDSFTGGRLLLGSSSWVDKDKNGNTKSWVVYPWHRSGSLNDDTGSSATSKLEYKKISNIRYAGHNTYLSNPWVPSYGISDVGIYDSTEDSIIKIDSNMSSSKIIYKGNYDKIITMDKTISDNGGYPINYSSSGTITASSTKSSEPIRIKYKSTPHAVFGFKNNGTTQVISPTYSNYNNFNGTTFTPFWGGNTTYTISQSNLTVQISETPGSGPTTHYSGLWIGELYRDVNLDTLFGGTSKEAIEANLWMPCGEATSLINTNGSNKTTATIEYIGGDTYFQRYDCLKTYMFSLTDTNSVSEMLSFLCETRIDLDARTDKNRGTVDTRTTTPLNFNLFNPVYNQKDNFFTYRVLNYDRFNLDAFPNTITWTKTKVAGDLIDTWTNITMASTLDLEGDKGTLTSIVNYKDELFTFQERALSTILYNSRVQVNTSDGVPIEIANSGKVDGKRILSSKIGSSNKLSIKESSNGIYFIDDNTKGIYLYNGNLENLTSKLGLNSWANSNIQSSNSNRLADVKFITSVDDINGKIYFTNGNNCLMYSEQLQQFITFVNYEGTPIMTNAFNKFLALRKPMNNQNDNYFNIWEQENGEYNKYFNVIKPSWTTILANENPQKDKIFNSIDLRVYSSLNGSTDAVVPFDRIYSWNEYQSGNIDLTQATNKPSSLKEKFGVWRANLPRVSSITNSSYRPINSNRFSILKDRMRNPWLYIKLYNSGLTGYKTKVQDITVNYSI